MTTTMMMMRMRMVPSSIWSHGVLFQSTTKIRIRTQTQTRMKINILENGKRDNSTVQSSSSPCHLHTPFSVQQHRTITTSTSIPTSASKPTSRMHSARIQVSPTELTRLNRTTARLYRILLRCIEKREGTLLLQPPLDPRDYGRARILSSRYCHSWPGKDIDGVGDDMEDEDGVMTGEILEFFHRWILEMNEDDSDYDDDDDLEDEEDDYQSEAQEYLRSMMTNLTNDTPKTNDNNVKTYDAESKSPSKLLGKRWMVRIVQPHLDSDHDTDNDNDNGYIELKTGTDMEAVIKRQQTKQALPDKALLVSQTNLKLALQTAFLRLNLSTQLDSSNSNSSSSSSSSSSSGPLLTKKDIVEMHRFAIEASKLVQEQQRMWNRTSVTVDEERKIRVVATSRCIGTGGTRNKLKHRFAYRIRVENFNSKSKSHSMNDSSYNVVQLLGRTWNIVEDDGNHDDEVGETVTVRAPSTGAVGHLPVIRPGEIFEYMSGCELESESGTMGGCFHMALVDDDATSAQVGDPIGAFHLGEDRKFEMPVDPFKLIADES